MLGQAACIKYWSRCVEGLIKSRSSVASTQNRGYYHAMCCKSTFSVLGRSAAHYNTYGDSSIAKCNPIYLFIDLDCTVKKNCVIHPILLLEEKLMNFAKPSLTFKFLFNIHCTQMLMGLLGSSRTDQNFIAAILKGQAFRPVNVHIKTVPFQLHC